MTNKLYFCASDIHSFYDEWIKSLKEKGFEYNNPNHIIIICGDLFDRGNQSQECFEFVQHMNSNNRLVYIRGNHEDLLISCIHDILEGRYVKSHHMSNGTVKTLSNFISSSEYDILCNCYDKYEFQKVINKLIQFIEDNTVNYFELGDKIFVHGWIPLTIDENNYEIVHENWKDGDWRNARWECGFDCWRAKLLPPENKTVVCGHWHTSYGWSEFRGLPEWGSNAKFEPFIDSNIVAIDGCTAYSKMVNVVVFDEKGNIITC